jgi:hypothetical protein
MGVRNDGHLLESESPRGSGGLKLFLGLAGLGLSAWLIWQLGPEKVWAQISGGSWSAFGWVIGAYMLQQALGTLALWLLGTREGRAGWRATSFWRLAGVRYVGEVLNYAMPTGAVGGEPYKYLVFGRSEGRHSTFKALAAAKFLHVTGAGLFAAVVFFGAAVHGIGGKPWLVSLFSFGVLSLFVTAMLWGIVLCHCVGHALPGGYYRVRRWVPRWLHEFRWLLHSDCAAALQIKSAWGRAMAAYACYVGMWWAAALEWLAIAKVLGIGWQELGVMGAGIFECVSIIVGAVILVPAGMGAQEAGKLGIAQVVGLAPQMGLAMSLVRRAREILMVLAGIILGLVEWRRTPYKR